MKKKLVLYSVLSLVFILIINDVFVAGDGHVEVVKENVSLIEENQTLTEQNQTLTEQNQFLTQENNQLNEKVSDLENTTKKNEKTTSNINNVESFEFAIPIQDDLPLPNN
jgi:predicted nuclease with TOPRIM domain